MGACSTLLVLVASDGFYLCSRYTEGGLSMAEQRLVQPGDKEFGPLSVAALKRLALTGEIRPMDQIYQGFAFVPPEVSP